MKRLKQAFSKKSGKSDTRQPLPKTPTLPQPQPHHHIPLGSGGILSREAFGNLFKPATFVGTTGTLNTVGVFFEISDTKCFIAHIDAYITSSSSVEPPATHYNTNFRTAALLREVLIARLDAAIPGERTKRMRDSLVMTCARLSGQESRAAEVVAKTLREWLDAGLSGGGRVTAAGSAFVAGWPGAGSVIFEQTPGEGWSAVECGVGQGAWSFGVEEGELEASEEAW